MYFCKRKSFGPRISLTERQSKRICKQLQASGLTCFVDQCCSGSVYVLIGLPEWSRNIDEEWYNTLDCGCDDNVAKIRLSGHDEGIRTDSTHNAVGTKRECMGALKRWLPQICEKHGSAGRKILAEKH